MKPGRGFASPLVEVEVVGMPCDVAKNKTHQVGKEERERERGGGKIHFVFSSGDYHCISFLQIITVLIRFGSQNLNLTSTILTVPS